MVNDRDAATAGLAADPKRVHGPGVGQADDMSRPISGRRSRRPSNSPAKPDGCRYASGPH